MLVKSEEKCEEDSKSESLCADGIGVLWYEG